MPIRAHLRGGIAAALTLAAAGAMLPAPAFAAGSVTTNDSTVGTQTWIVTSDIGVLTRTAARQDATAGYGPAAGEVLIDLCQVTDGDPVGVYANQTWHYMQRPNGARTWVADTWLSTPNLASQPTPGTPYCSSSSGDPFTVAEPQPAGESPILYGGDSDLDYWSVLPMSYALYNHYMWAGGTDAVLDGARVAASPGFREEVYTLPVGGFTNWRAPYGSDLQLAVGTFFLSRETENCWAMYDWYDFSPNMPTDPTSVGQWGAMVRDAVGYWPFAVYQAGGARPFHVNSSGCFAS